MSLAGSSHLPALERRLDIQISFGRLCGPDDVAEFAESTAEFYPEAARQGRCLISR